MAGGIATIFAIVGWIALGLVLLLILWGISRFINNVLTYAERQCAEVYGEEVTTARKPGRDGLHQAVVTETRFGTSHGSALHNETPPTP